ncbi:MAG: PIN domain-containing protein [Candidatus Nanohaloarchaea archaeon]|nr:PIN domain-containing protein [Candidatus Nanohaloarchaea archaeon]
MDSSYIVALDNTDDEHHGDALELREELRSSGMYISDYIYDEVVTLTLQWNGHGEAVRLSDYLLRSDVTVLQVASPVFRSAVELFEEHPVSFTDCTSVALMRHVGIDQMASFDTDFDAFDDIAVSP